MPRVSKQQQLIQKAKAFLDWRLAKRVMADSDDSDDSLDDIIDIIACHNLQLLLANHYVSRGWYIGTGAPPQQTAILWRIWKKRLVEPPAKMRVEWSSPG